MIKKVVIKNFKNIKNAEYDLKEVNIFSGVNEIGKTNTLNAIYWLLTGELICDDKDKAKMLNNIISNEDNRAVASVELILEDGTSLRREYFQKWSRTRGTIDEKYEGNTTASYINDSLIKEKVWEEKVLNAFNSNYDLSVSEINKMAALVDPLYLLMKIKPDTLRKFISYFVKPITDLELVDKNPKYEALKSMLNNNTPEELRTSYRGKTLKYKENIDRKIGEINAYKNDAPDNTKLEEVKSKVSKLESKLGTYQVSEFLIKEKELYQEISSNFVEASNKVIDLESELKKSEFDDSSKNINQKEIDKKLEINACENEINRLMNVGKNKKYDREMAQLEANRKNEKIVAMSNEIEYRQGKIASIFNEKFEEELCPNCNYVLNEASKEDFKKVQNEKVETEKERINVLENDIEKLKEEIKEHENIASNCYDSMAEIQKEIDAQKVKKSSLELELETIQNKQKTAYVSEKTNLLKYDLEQAKMACEYQKKNKELQKQKVEKMFDEEKTSQQNYQASIRLELEPLRNELIALEVAKENCKKLDQAQEELKDIYKAQALDEEMLILIDNFIKEKINDLNEKTNLFFDNKLEFVMIEEQKNGGLKEVCYLTYKDVPFDAINTSDKLILGVKVINSLRANLGISSELPILFDKAESLDNSKINELKSGQVITTKVDNENRNITLFN